MLIAEAASISACARIWSVVRVLSVVFIAFFFLWASAFQKLFHDFPIGTRQKWYRKPAYLLGSAGMRVQKLARPGALVLRKVRK